MLHSKRRVLHISLLDGLNEQRFEMLCSFNLQSRYRIIKILLFILKFFFLVFFIFLLSLTDIFLGRSFPNPVIFFIREIISNVDLFLRLLVLKLVFAPNFVDLKQVNIRTVFKLNSSYGRDLLLFH